MAALMGMLTAAAASVLMLMMCTDCIRIIIQASCQKCLHLGIRISACSGIKLDPCLCQRIPCTAADTSADQHLSTALIQKSGQGTMSAAIGIYHFRGYDLTVLHLIYLELFCVSKMLKYLSIVICHCNLHV